RRTQLGNRRQILDRNGTPIEEVARVVELDARRERFSERRKRVGDLFGERARRRRSIERESPQVAERAREGTLRAGEKDRQRPLDSPIRTPLVLEQGSVRFPWIDDWLTRAKLLNPAVGRPGG